METDDIEEDSRPMFRTNFTRRYPRDDPRYILTPEDAEVTKKKYILRTLKECTKVRDAY